MPRVCCRLAGGLGNQIFQYGASLLIKKRINAPLIELDISALTCYKASRNNELPNYFKINNAIFKKNRLLKLRLPRFSFLAKYCDIFVGDSNFHKLISKYLSARNYYLDGYFQSCLTQVDFDEMLELLKEDFRYNELDVKKRICAVHIRGGDFLTEKYGGIASFDYYLEKINKVKKLNLADEFVIVTDDRAHANVLVKKISINYSFSEGNMLSDFLLLAQAQVKILSNSTFSIWASALGCHSTCTVFAPTKFTNNDTRNFILPGELLI